MRSPPRRPRARLLEQLPVARRHRAGRLPRARAAARRSGRGLAASARPPRSVRYLGDLAGVVAVVAVGDRLDERRPAAASRALARLERRAVDGTDVLAVDLDRRKPEPCRALGDRGAGDRAADVGLDRVLVVLADGDQRQLLAGRRSSSPPRCAPCSRRPRRRTRRRPGPSSASFAASAAPIAIPSEAPTIPFDPK